jgi:hypothetical protein
MSEYTEMLNKIFISTKGLTLSESVIYYRIAESIGLLMFIFGALMIFEHEGELSQLFNKIWKKFYGALTLLFILGGLSLVFVGVRNPSNCGENYTLTRESKIALSDYVSNLNKDERENLTTHVKLYSDVFDSESDTLKLINKYLMETIGK